MASLHGIYITNSMDMGAYSKGGLAIKKSMMSLCRTGNMQTTRWVDKIPVCNIRSELVPGTKNVI